MEQERLDHLDAARAIAVLLVLFGHTIRPSMRASAFWCELAYQFVYRFHVSLLFLVSGACFQLRAEARKTQPMLRCLRAKADRLLRPWLSYALLLYLAFALAQCVPFCRDVLSAGGVRLLSPAEYALAVLQNENPYGFHLWYLQTLFLFASFALLLERYLPPVWLRRAQWALLVLVPGFYQIFCQEWIWGFKAFFQKLPCFLLGWILPQQKFCRRAKFFAGAGAVCGSVILWQLLCQPSSVCGGALLSAYSAYLPEAGLCLGILAGCFLLRSRLHLLAQFGCRTLAYYLYHQPLCGAFLGLLLYDKLGLAPVLVCVFCMAASLLVPYLVCRVACRVGLAPFLARLGLPTAKEV